MSHALLGGQLFSFFGITLLVTLLVSLLGVWHYGRRVLAGMGQRGSSDALPWPGATLGARAWPLATDGPRAAAWLARTERRVIGAWLASALLAALPVAGVYLLASGELSGPAQLLMVASVLAQVAVPVVAVSLGWTALRAARLALVLLAAGALLTLGLSVLQRLARGAAPTLDQLFNLGWYVAGAGVLLALPALLLLLSGPARIRQVVPMVFGTLVLFASAPFIAGQTFGAVTDSASGTAWVRSLGVPGLRHGVFVLLALPVGWLVSRRLRSLARAHAAKRFSEVQLLARSWWLMLVCGLVIQLINSDSAPWWAGPACALAGLAFAPAQGLVLRRWPVVPPASAPPPRTLLFLRAFGWQSRTERLFDRLGARWRYLGPITMIAAPDVVARSMAQADLLAYLQGREDEAFVRNAHELQARLAAIDQARDPDGRFRLNAFCCIDTTWRATVVALMDRADAVLMDLRGLQAKAEGCAFELGQLAQRLPPQRVVLVIDGQTRLPPLRAALGAAADSVVWHRMDQDNAGTQAALLAAVMQAAA